MSRVEEAKKNSNWQQHSHPTKVLTLVSSTRAHLIFNKTITTPFRDTHRTSCCDYGCMSVLVCVGTGRGSALIV